MSKHVIKTLVAALALAVASLAFALPASAGEITGNGKLTPIKERQSFPDAPAGPANSFCAFSGLNDDPAEDGNHTQSWGTGVRDVIEETGGGVGPIVVALGGLNEIGPGTACRGL